MPEVRIRIEAVVVVGRHRKDLGDIEALAADIKANGLINPITLTTDNRLLAGQRRLEACKALGWESIPARVIDTLADAGRALRIERSENTERKPMLPSELVSLGMALEELEQPKAIARRAAPLKRGTASPFRSPDRNGTGETREVVAEALGVSSSHYDRARFVVEAATNPDLSEEERSNAQEALKEMDATGKVSPAYQKVRSMTDRPRVGSPRPAPERPTIAGAVEQRRALAAAVVTLSGVSYGLEQITEIHPDITSEEAAQWVDGLWKSRLIVTQLIKRLKEHNNAKL